MTTIALLLTALLSYISVMFLIKYAHKLDLYDVPNERSHHCSVTPRGAGIGFVSALFLSLAFFEFSLFSSYWYIFLAIFVVFVIGVIDDKSDVSARLKFIFIFIAIFLLWLNDLTIDTLGIWFGHEVTLHTIVALLFSLFALAGYTNALNLIDGIDGLSSTISIVILSFFLLVGLEYQSDIIVTLSSFTIAVLVGFLFFNWNPAKIFMGDSGSLTLGFIISVLCILSIEYIHPVAVLYLTAIPTLDTLIVMVRRIRRGKSPFSPDKTHIHHILVKFFDNNVKKTVFFLAVLQSVFGGIGYALLDMINSDNSIKNTPLFGLLGFALLFVIFYMIFTGIKKRQKLIDKRKRRGSKS